VRAQVPSGFGTGPVVLFGAGLVLVILFAYIGYRANEGLLLFPG